MGIAVDVSVAEVLVAVVVPVLVPPQPVISKAKVTSNPEVRAAEFFIGEQANNY
jgi:hypothetical protein